MTGLILLEIVYNVKKKLAGFNSTVIHKKAKEKSNADGLSRSSHMAEALPLEGDKYAKFYEIDEPVVRFEGGVNEIQHIQRSLMENPQRTIQGQSLEQSDPLGREGTVTREGGD